MNKSDLNVTWIYVAKYKNSMYPFFRTLSCSEYGCWKRLSRALELDTRYSSFLVQELSKVGWSIFRLNVQRDETYVPRVPRGGIRSRKHKDKVLVRMQEITKDRYWLEKLERRPLSGNALSEDGA